MKILETLDINNCDDLVKMGDFEDFEPVIIDFNNKYWEHPLINYFQDSNMLWRHHVSYDNGKIMTVVLEHQNGLCTLSDEEIHSAITTLIYIMNSPNHLFYHPSPAEWMKEDGMEEETFPEYIKHMVDGIDFSEEFKNDLDFTVTHSMPVDVVYNDKLRRYTYHSRTY